MKDTYTITIVSHFDSLTDAMAWANEIDQQTASYDGLAHFLVKEGGEYDTDGVFCEGCDGHVFSGIRWPTACNDDSTHDWVERCDNCERFDSDDAAAEWLVESYGPDTATLHYAVPAGLDGEHPYVVTN